MKTYDKREIIAVNMRPCFKRPVVEHAKRMNEPFRVTTVEGEYEQGKAGDYLMRGVDGELYICDKETFFKSYNFQEEERTITYI